MPGNPGVKRRRGLLEQCKLLDAGILGRLHSQFACFLVEAGGHSQHDLSARLTAHHSVFSQAARR